MNLFQKLRTAVALWRSLFFPPPRSQVDVGCDVPSCVDVEGMAGHRIKVNISRAVGDFGKIGLAVVNARPALTEIYIENQDGNGNRLGALTLGVDADGSAFIGATGRFRIIDPLSPYPHADLWTVDRKDIKP